MTEIVINRCPRGTLLSDAGKAEYLKRKEISGDFDWAALDRADPVLVAMMKEDAGTRAWGGECSQVRFVTIPDGLAWRINRNRGLEWVDAGGLDA